MLCQPVTHELSTVVETRGVMATAARPQLLWARPGPAAPASVWRNAGNWARHHHSPWPASNGTSCIWPGPMAVAGSTAFCARLGTGLHPGGEGWTCTRHTGSHLSCSSPPESPRRLCAPSAQNPENGPLFVIYRKDGMRTTPIKSHVIY